MSCTDAMMRHSAKLHWERKDLEGYTSNVFIPWSADINHFQLQASKWYTRSSVIAARPCDADA